MNPVWLHFTQCTEFKWCSIITWSSSWFIPSNNIAGQIGSNKICVYERDLYIEQMYRSFLLLFRLILINSLIYYIICSAFLVFYLYTRVNVQIDKSTRKVWNSCVGSGWQTMVYKSSWGKKHETRLELAIWVASGLETIGNEILKPQIRVQQKQMGKYNCIIRKNVNLHEVEWEKSQPLI